MGNCVTKQSLKNDESDLKLQNECNLSKRSSEPVINSQIISSKEDVSQVCKSLECNSNGLSLNTVFVELCQKVCLFFCYVRALIIKILFYQFLGRH